jgi:hypothetical protein
MSQSEPTKFAVLAACAKSLTARIKLPAPVAAIYQAVAELEAAYLTWRRLTPIPQRASLGSGSPERVEPATWEMTLPGFAGYRRTRAA